MQMYNMLRTAHHPHYIDDPSLPEPQTPLESRCCLVFAISI